MNNEHLRGENHINFQRSSKGENFYLFLKIFFPSFVLTCNRRITKPDYDKKLQEIMDRIQTLVMEMEEHSRADHDYKTTVGTVLSVARRSREIFEGAELPEKRQFINFLVQNPQLKERALIFELKRSMNTVLELAHYSASKRKTIGISTDRLSWLGGWGSNPRPIG